MSFLTGLATKFLTALANRIADEVILIIRKRMKVKEIDDKATQMKEDLKSAESTSEREAILDQIHDLINDFDGL